MPTHSLHRPLVMAAAALLAAGGALQAQIDPASFTASVRPLAEIERAELPRLDNRALAAAADAEARARALPGAPYRFATPVDVVFSPASAGAWETADDGSRIWRLRLRSPGATGLGLRFDRYDLEPGSTLWLYDPAREHFRGPYGAGDGNVRGELWTAPIPGEEVVVEIDLPAGADEPELVIGRVHHGFRPLPAPDQPVKGHGSCNVDVVCPEGDPWRDQARATMVLIYDGSFTCTGQLVNNTDLDQRPYVLSAYHCITDPFEAPDFDLIPTIVALFNFEAPVCGQQANGDVSQTVAGATFVAGEPSTDFLLVELDQAPPPEFEPYFVGWNVSGQSPGAGVGIHHPDGDVKSISFDHDPITVDDQLFVNPPDTHWRVGDWELGITEPGSSGSCLYDPADGLCVGVLTGGLAACPEDDPEGTEDYYGRLSAAWEVGGDPQTRLRDWLDPAGLGTPTLEGMGAASDCVPSETVMCLLGGRFKVELEWATRVARGPAKVVPQGSPNSGMFYFFNANNWEMLIKVLNNCAGPTNRYWVFAAATTTLEYVLTVTDTTAGLVKVYRNPFGQSSPAITDTDAFATCP